MLLYRFAVLAVLHFDTSSESMNRLLLLNTSVILKVQIGIHYEESIFQIQPAHSREQTVFLPLVYFPAKVAFLLTKRSGGCPDLLLKFGLTCETVILAAEVGSKPCRLKLSTEEHNFNSCVELLLTKTLKSATE